MNGSGGVGEKTGLLERAAGKEGPWGRDWGVRVQLEPEGEEVQLRRRHCRGHGGRFWWGCRVQWGQSLRRGHAWASWGD